MEYVFQLVWVFFSLFLLVAASWLLLRGHFDSDNRFVYYRFFTVYVALFFAVLMVGIALDSWNRQTRVSRISHEQSLKFYSDTSVELQRKLANVIDIHRDTNAVAHASQKILGTLLQETRDTSVKTNQFQLQLLQGLPENEKNIIKETRKLSGAECSLSAGEELVSGKWSIDGCSPKNSGLASDWLPVLVELAFINGRLTQKIDMSNLKPPPPSEPELGSLLDTLSSDSTWVLTPETWREFAQDHLDPGYQITLLFRTPAFKLGQPLTDCECGSDQCQVPALGSDNAIDEALTWLNERKQSGDLVSLIAIGRHDAIPYYGGDNRELAKRRAKCVVDMLNVVDIPVEYGAASNRYSWTSSTDQSMREDRSVEVYAVYLEASREDSK